MDFWNLMKEIMSALFLIVKALLGGIFLSNWLIRWLRLWESLIQAEIIITTMLSLEKTEHFHKIKVETILKGSLDMIPSPSVKIQIMGGRILGH